MKKILLSVFALAAVSTASAQAFFTKTCYRGAFAPAPTAMWTDSWTEWNPQNKVYGTPTQTVSANITSNTSWSGVVLIQGPIYVKNNSVLNIAPGTVILASKAVAGSALIVTKGSQINAVGTAASPIVFTSDQAPGSRAVGDWGGVMLLGNAALNFTNGINNVEGLPVTTDTEFGGGATPNNNDNSGTLKYVRIEFGGYVYQPNKEINGLTMGAVGKGTTLEYIQTSFTNDDGFEWFGGNVNAKYLVSYRNLDDDFDTDNGFSGNVQFGLIVRDPDLADAPAVSTSEGFESDNDASGTTATPQTSAIFSNITMVGPFRGASTNTVAAGYRRGARIRRNSALKIYNSIFMDVQRGIHIDGSLCEGNANSGSLKFKNNIIAGTAAGRVTEVNSGSTFNAPAWFGANANDSIPYSAASFTNLLVAPYNYFSPDYRPTSVSMALSNVSYTDAVLAGVTNNFSSNVAVSTPTSACLGQIGALQDFTFAATNTLSSEYCSMSWSVSPGVTISSTTAMNPTFTISTIGTFTVYLMVTDANGSQMAMSSITTNTCLDVAVGEEKNQIGSIALYPNPASEQVTLRITTQNAGVINASVYDITGKLVLSPVQNQTLVNGENSFNLSTSELQNGVYFVTLSSAKGKETVKLIVNK